ncbi:metalloprotease [Acinetobacter haemolyticus]|uniref:metalloprotease n=1 Tax=Acinetobacter haemolyticus TaxID=29430 RepID=UPI0002D3B555|nr:metalloprotease [Acinetobacter haemolyticus]NAR51435.1 metalloprotease [Acinetobacter haemolyticus]NAR55533.1 metalloprotease [Acinetobacter haemolyticus]NAR62029.1 metalloprotease [Acinetobacter haemolyticus]NAR68540.1 metalloprotease [Acinetobacter haemolyticus]NAR71792.1 metalloprotease [Acinetobacter haemolyticus]
MAYKKITTLFMISVVCVACSTKEKSYVELEKHPIKLHKEEESTLPVVYVSFVYTTNTPKAREYDNRNQMLKEINILNQYFVDENNQKIFRFKPYRYFSYENFNKRNCDLAYQLNQPRKIITENIPAAVKRCFPERRSKEVFFIIYDSYSDRLKFRDVTSWGFRNTGQPFILIDWQRLNYNIQAATPHEMGHAFGLKHVCAPGAKLKDSTNIMTSADCKLGSGGQRNIGFNREQLSTIMDYYHRAK